jgi:hypothetical protein
MVTKYTTGVNSRCSSGNSPNQINDKIEAKLIKAELFFNEKGKSWGVSVLSGGGRIIFGLVEIVGAFFLAFFKLLEAAGTALFYDKERAALPLKECGWAITYMGHGVANMARGLIEIFQIAAKCKFDSFNHPIKYHSEDQNLILRAEAKARAEEDESYMYEDRPPHAFSLDQWNEDMPLLAKSDQL